jgi:hypothetical protein
VERQVFFNACSHAGIVHVGCFCFRLSDVSVTFSTLMICFIHVFKKKMFVTCPYNERHQVRFDRMQYHLVKCRRNYPDADFAICPYNASHHVPRINLESHLQKCPSQPVARCFNQDPPEDEKYVVYGSSFVPYECDPDFPESFPEFPLTPVSKVNLWGLGRGSLVTSTPPRRKVTFSSTDAKCDENQEGSARRVGLGRGQLIQLSQGDNKEGSARRVGLGRAQLIRLYLENRKKFANWSFLKIISRTRNKLKFHSFLFFICKTFFLNFSYKERVVID